MYKYDMSDFENEEQKRKYIKEVLNEDAKKYKEFSTQREERSQKRLDKEKRRKLIKRATAIAVGLGLVAGAGTYAKDKLSSSDKYEKEANNNQTTYEEYIDYVNDQRELGIEIEISEDGYNDFLNSQNQSKGSR